MDVKRELSEIEEWLNGMSVEEFDNMLERNGVGDNRYSSIFDDMTDQEFCELLDECGLEYKKVKPGKGGLFIDGKRIESVEELDNLKKINTGVSLGVILPMNKEIGDELLKQDKDNYLDEDTLNKCKKLIDAKINK